MPSSIRQPDILWRRTTLCTTTLFAAALVVCGGAGEAAAALRWSAQYGTKLDLSQWTRLDCGGTGGSCPCLPNFAAGRCDPLSSTTSSSHAMPNPIAPGAGSRMQVVPDPAGSADKVLRVQLRPGDAFNDSQSVTTRVEMAHPSSTGQFSQFVRGDDFYFAFSIYLPSASFDHWNCTNTAPSPLPPSYDGRCPNGVPDAPSGKYSAWNVITQWHGPGGPDFAMHLQRLYESTTQQYQMYLSSFDGFIWHDTGDPSKGGAVFTNTWYHFIIHIVFNTPGTMEVWKAMGNGPFVKQTMNGGHDDHIPGSYLVNCQSVSPDGTVCTTNTLDTTNAPLQVYMKQGHYRNPTLTDSTELFYNHTAYGDTFNDVAALFASNPDFALGVSPSSVTSSAGASATATATVTAQSGFTGTVSLSASGVPAGATASFTPASVAGSGSSTLTLAPGTAAAGTYTVNVTGTSGTISHSSAVSWTISTGGPNPAVSSLSDSLGGATVDSTKWATPVQTLGTVTEGGGFLHLTPNSGTGSAQVYVQSSGLYSLIGSAAYVKVPQVVAADGAVDNNLALVQDAANAVAWWYSAGTLTATRTTANVKTTVVSVPYSASTHAWWRIRESGGTVSWDTSPDGQTWTTQGTTPTGNVAYVSAVRPMFYAETSGAGSASPGEARYSNFNVPPATTCTPANPAVATLSDTFGGAGIDSTKWAPVQQTLGTVTESGGFLHQAPNANVAGASLLLQSNGTYSLVGSAAFVKAAQMVGNGGIDTNFTLLTDSSNLVSWYYENGSLHARKVVAGVDTTLATAAYSATTHAWLRLRESGGTVFWETSPDGTTWSALVSAPTTSVPFVCGGKVVFFTETWGTGSASPGEARYANLNTAAGNGTQPVSSLSDAFAGTTVDTTKWTVSATGGTTTEGGGSLNMAPTVSTPTTRLAVTSVSKYTLTNSQMQVKLTSVPQGSINTRFALLNSTNEDMGFWIEQGTVYCYYFVGATEMDVAVLTYSPTAFAWMRVRHDGTTVFWETSPDGVTWTVQGSIAKTSISYADAAMNLKISVSGFGTGASSTTPAKYLNLN
ncbi:MAG TPA: hypothetical protein VFE90_06705 [Myxococcales bacterium]|nr:hypothetical protein [Myxococcales bacterium]